MEIIILISVLLLLSLLLHPRARATLLGLSKLTVFLLTMLFVLSERAFLLARRRLTRRFS